MAGLCGLKILLLLAGLITLAHCQDVATVSAPLPPHTHASTAPPASNVSDTFSPTRNMTAAPVMSSASSITAASPPLTSLNASTTPDVSAPLPPHTHANPAPSASNVSDTFSPPRNMTAAPVMSSASSITAASPPLTSLNASTTPATPASTSPAPTATSDNKDSTLSPASNEPITKGASTIAAPGQAPSATPLQCSYTVQPIPFGLQILLNSSTNGSFWINITEKDNPLSGNKSEVYQDKGNATYKITHLKPCTTYNHSVAFIGNESNKMCNLTMGTPQTTTKNLLKDDVANSSCGHWDLCYTSEWNIRTSMSASNNGSVYQCPTDIKVFCIPLGFKDFCTHLTTSFTSGQCPDPFQLTREITVTDFLSPEEILQEKPTGLPTIMEPPLPPNCTNLKPIKYSCLDESNSTKSVSELEPFTDYTCTGRVIENNTWIRNTSAIKFNVDCDFKPKIMGSKTVTNTSIKFNWETMSSNCETFTPKLKYTCTCSSDQPSKQGSASSDKRSCLVKELTPFKVYNCKVQPFYKDKKVGELDEFKEQTDPGTPDDIKSMQTAVHDNNVIKVSCGPIENFYGAKKKYKASLWLNNARVGLEQEEEECQFKFEDLSYLTTYTAKVQAFNGELHGKIIQKDESTSYNDKAVIGFLIFLIILTTVALLLVVYKIFILKHRRSHHMGESIKLIQTNDEENLLSVEPITAEGLLDAYKMKLADEGRLFLAEFQSIPRIFSRYSVKEAKKVCNGPKNRYVDILPYDYNRVLLTTGNGEAGCDYINASFIDGYKESKKYIAAQGPKEETICDFWRMIWEQQSSIIVMVTRCEEGNRVKCAQYWPSEDRNTEIYEEFIVKLNSVEVYPDYIIRRLSLTNKREKNSEREVTHIQFMSWPDHGVPGEPQLLLKLRRRVNSFKNFFSGPIVVHCSAGVGRTGTYISIDAMMECLEAERRLDIYGYVVRLRRQRCLMVQVEAQYILIHQALLEHNQFGETEISLNELHSALSTLKQKNSDSEPTLLEDEFERLPSFKNWRTFNSGMTEENKKKNRSSSVIHVNDYNRVLLKLDEGNSRESEPDEDDDEEESSDEEDEESTKYINASHVVGYWGPHAIIAAQTPLPDTRGEFWSMVNQKKASCIIMLSDCSEAEKSDCAYWDEDKKIFGDFEVEVLSTDITPNYITRNMLLRHVKRKESRPLKQFQFLKWESGDLPEKPQHLTDMIKEIKQGNKSQRSQPILVHCNDGSSRTGLFCALWNVLDSAETEKLVDVFQVVKTLRKERQGMMLSLEQYQFLYDALEGVFPVQNGEVKAATAPPSDSVHIESETAAEQPASTTSVAPQGEAESSPLVPDEEKEEKKEEMDKSPTEAEPMVDSSNGPTVTVEV